MISGAELSAAFYAEVVAPILGPTPHSGGLLGWGSDVLGYDTERSTDHGWGPRVTVFVESTDVAAAISAGLDDRLPAAFGGWPVRFGWAGRADSHHVTVTTLPAWLTEELGFDATTTVTTLDWLLTPQQRLLGVVAGAVHNDDTGALTEVRGRLAWYPDDVWPWLLACGWQRIAQEEAFVARTAEVGDGTGSAITAARLARDIMRLALLLARRYAPYQKWLGTAFAQLDHPDDLPEYLANAMAARDSSTRENALADAFRALARRHNALGLSDPLSDAIGDFHDRPARVLMADRFAQASLTPDLDPALRTVPLIGSIDQVVDSTEVLTSPAILRRLAGLYAGVGGAPGGP